MKKNLFFFAAMYFSLIANAQIKIEGVSDIRKLVSYATEFNFLRDWGVTAEFKSGKDEYVKFFPIEYTDLTTKKKVKAIQLDVMVLQDEGSAVSSIGIPISKKGEIKRSVWLDINEAQQFVKFLEEQVIANLKVKHKDKSSEYIFKAKEMVFSYFIYEKDRRITIRVIDFGPYGGDSAGGTIEFWTETQVEMIGGLVLVLKKI